MPTSTMKALRKMRPERGAQIESVPIPALGPTQVLVRVRAASICGTDLHIYGWDRWSASRIKPPMTFGHEFCGVVEKVGDEVTSVKPGDFVSAEMHVNCGHCRPCRMGQPHVCQNVKIIGIDADGCFAEFVRIPVRNIWKIDPAIPEHYAAILDPLGNAVHTVLAGEIAGLNVVVTGAGPIGLMAIAVARACGCASLFATEVNAHRRELAIKMGADEVLDPSAGDVVERVLRSHRRRRRRRDARNERQSRRDSPGLRNASPRRTRLPPRHPQRSRHLRSGQRRDLQRRHRPGNLRPQNVRDVGADDRTPQSTIASISNRFSTNACPSTISKKPFPSSNPAKPAKSSSIPTAPKYCDSRSESYPESIAPTSLSIGL